MPIRETLTAKPVSLAEVLSNGKRYSVPRFQRDYAWAESEWAELWADICDVHRAAPDTNHYLGALVLQPGERGDSRIIDGQQRLVTLSVLALAVIKRIDELARARGRARGQSRAVAPAARALRQHPRDSGLAPAPQPLDPERSR
jgi:hypothetical protein